MFVREILRDEKIIWNVIPRKSHARIDTAKTCRNEMKWFSIFFFFLPKILLFHFFLCMNKKKIMMIIRKINKSLNSYNNKEEWAREKISESFSFSKNALCVKSKTMVIFCFVLNIYDDIGQQQKNLHWHFITAYSFISSRSVS